MKPEIWVPAAATVLAPLLQVLTSGLIDQRKTNTDRFDRLRPRSKARTALFWSLIASVPVSLAIWLLPLPRRWIFAAAFLAAFAALQALLIWLDRRRLPMTPEAEKFMTAATGQTGGHKYGQRLMPDLVRVYTKNDLTSGTSSTPSAASSESAGTEEPQKDAEGEQRTAFEKVLVDPTVKHIAITGEAGIGKTSLLEFWARELRLRKPSTGDRLSKLRPVLIAARSLVGKESLAAAFGGADAESLSRSPGRGLTWLVMIDAFDEITDPDEREAVERIVFESVDLASSGRTACKFVLTSRGLSDRRQRNFDSHGISLFRLQPFTKAQLREYLIRENTGPTDRELKNRTYQDAVENADRFLHRWDGHDDLLDLIRLPLLANVTATIYFNRQLLQIPRRRIDIYHDAIEHWIAQFHKRLDNEKLVPALALLHDWHAKTTGANAPDTDAAIRLLLRTLAIDYLRSNRSVVELAAELFALPLQSWDQSKLESLQTLLQDTGLIHDVRTSKPTFVHKTFAEYLAAPTVKHMFWPPSRWDAVLRDPDSRVAAVFDVAKTDPLSRDEVIDSLAGDERYAIATGWLAVEGLCVSANGAVDEERRKELIDLALAAMPAQLSDEWEQLVTGLASTGYGRDLLCRIVEERRISDWTLLYIARQVARQEQRGVELLRRMATEERVYDQQRVDAADYLGEFDAEGSIALLRQFASARAFPDAPRLDALRLLAGRGSAKHRRRLRRFARSDTSLPSLQVSAAAALLDHDPGKAIRLLRRHASRRTADAFAAVTAATKLADYRRAEGIALLHDLALDTSVSDFVRVTAAGNLVEFDRQRGMALLRDFASKAFGFDGNALVSATYRIAANEGRPGVGEMTALAADHTLSDGARVDAARMIGVEDPAGSQRLLEGFAADTVFNDIDRANAVDDLVEFDRPRWVPRLREIANDGSFGDYARTSAAGWLAGRDRSQGVPLLKALEEDPSLSHDARLNAITWRLSLGDEDAARRIRQIAMDLEVDASARVEAAYQLAIRRRPGGLRLLRSLAAEDRLPDAQRVGALQDSIQLAGGRHSGRLRDWATDSGRSESSRTSAAKALALYDRADAVRHLQTFSTRAEFSDQGRSDAATDLASVDRALGLDVLERLVQDAALVGPARHTAALGLERYGAPLGLAALQEMAHDTSLHGTTAPDAAFQIAIRGDMEGVDLLIEHSSDRNLLDFARVAAAQGLVELDRGTGLERLRELASGALEDPWSHVNAANALALHDPEAGMPLLRALAAEGATDVLRAIATVKLCFLRRRDAMAALPAMCEDRSLSGQARLIAVDGLATVDRKAGLPILARFAGSDEIGGRARATAGYRLSEFDQTGAIRLLRATAADDSQDPIVRVSAVDNLLQIGVPASSHQLAAMAQDAAFEGIARVGAASALTWSFMEKGVGLLRSLAGDASLDRTVRCWATIVLAEWDPSTDDLLATEFGGQGEVDIERLRSATTDLLEMDKRSGGPAMRRVRELARVREERVGPGGFHQSPPGPVGSAS